MRQFTPLPVHLGKGGGNFPYTLTDRIVERGEWLAIMPEGYSTAIYEGYRLWRFFPGVIRLYLRYRILVLDLSKHGLVC